MSTKCDDLIPPPSIDSETKKIDIRHVTGRSPVMNLLRDAGVELDVDWRAASA